MRRVDRRHALSRFTVPFVADERLAAVLPPHFPERRVAREDREPAAAIDERLEAIALRTGPVFTVADEHDRAVVVERRRILVEIEVGQIIERDAFILRPANEGMLPFVEIACGIVVWRWAVRARPVVIAGPASFLKAALPEIDQSRHALRRRQQRLRKRPLGREHADGAFHRVGKRHAPFHQRIDVAIGAGAAPVIVGVQRVGREHEDGAGARAVGRSLDADKMMRGLTGGIREDDIVVTRAPVRADVEGKAFQARRSRCDRRAAEPGARLSRCRHARTSPRAWRRRARSRSG